MHSRRYLINEDFFDSIDSENKAYTLGFIYADGCVRNSYKRKYFDIELKLSDKQILEDISKFFYQDPADKVKSRIRNRKIEDSIRIEESCRLSVYSTKLVEKLCELGCVPRKSLELKWPNWIVDEEIKKHFIRGYFDGDGSIRMPQKKSASIDIIGTSDFCIGIQNAVNDNIKLSSNVRKDISSEMFRFEISGNKNTKKFFDWLYKDSSIFLLRKYNKYLKLCKKLQDRKWYVYLIRSMKDNTIYTGITKNVEARLKTHNEGRGARYTRGRGPFIIVKYFEVESKSKALKIEYKIKQLSKQEKLDFKLQKE